MNIVSILLITAYQLLIMSFSQYPIWIVNKAYSKSHTNPNYNSVILASISITALTLFVSFSNIMVLYDGFELLKLKPFEYISILYGVILIAIVSGAIYHIAGEYIIYAKIKFSRNAIRISSIIVIIVALLLLYSTIIANNEIGANYVHVSNNYIMPLFTCIFIVPIILNIIQKRSFKAILNTRSIILISAVIFSLFDLFFIDVPSFQLVTILYCAYTAHVYRILMLNATNSKKPNETHIKKNDFMEKYSLSEREMEVISLAAKGLTNNEIAMNLVLSPHTVKSHLKRIFTKLNIDSRHKLQSILSPVDFDK